MEFSLKTLFTRKRESSDSSTDTAASASAVATTIATAADSVTSRSSSRVIVNAHTSLMCPAYLRALNVIAQHVAVLPFRYMWLKDGIYVEKEGDANHYLTSVQMMDNMSNYQYYFQLAMRTVHYGESLIYPIVVMGEPMSYILVEENTWTYDDMNHEYTICDCKNGVYGVFKEEEVLHFVWNSIDGKHGIPLWKLCQPALNIYATGDKETEKRFASGGNVKGIVSNSVQQGGTGIGQYKTKTLSNVADEMESQQRQGRNIYSLGGDIHFNQLSSSSADMQMTDQQKRVVNEIARAAGVPTYMLYVETSGTQYNTPEVAMKAFLTQTLEPMLRMIESEFQRKMVPRSLCHKRVFRFDRDAIYTLDLKSKADYIAKTIANGTHTINDWRKKENQPTIDGGDETLVTANLMTVDALKAKGTSPAPSQGGENKTTDNTDGAQEPQQKEKPRDAHGRFVKQR